MSHQARSMLARGFRDTGNEEGQTRDDRWQPSIRRGDPGRRACPGAGSGWRLKKRGTGECLTPIDRRLTLATPRCGILVELLPPQSETPKTFGHRIVVARLPVRSTDGTTHRFVIPVNAARTAGGANANPGRHAD
jgi:hypothetical protein